ALLYSTSVPSDGLASLQLRWPSEKEVHCTETTSVWSGSLMSPGTGSSPSQSPPPPSPPRIPPELSSLVQSVPPRPRKPALSARRPSFTSGAPCTPSIQARTRFVAAEWLIRVTWHELCWAAIWQVVSGVVGCAVGSTVKSIVVGELAACDSLAVSVAVSVAVAVSSRLTCRLGPSGGAAAARAGRLARTTVGRSPPRRARATRSMGRERRLEARRAAIWGHCRTADPQTCAIPADKPGIPQAGKERRVDLPDSEAVEVWKHGAWRRGHGRR